MYQWRKAGKVCKFILDAVLAAAFDCGFVFCFFFFFVHMNQGISSETDEYLHHFRGMSDKKHHILLVFHSLSCLKANT